jgi:phosphoenolpyruvate carboxylase
MASYNQLVGTKYHIYNSLFLNLPFRQIEHTGTLLPLFQQYCDTGFRKGQTAKEIVADFFSAFAQHASADEQFDLLFKFIQYVERQVALFDAVEDSAFEQINDLGGKGTLKALLLRARAENCENALKEKLQQFSLRVVLTAHPTQFYPGAVLGILNDLETAIRDNDLINIDLLLQQLGKTGFINKDKPSPYDEAVSLCWFLENVFYTAISEIVQQLTVSLKLSPESWTNNRLITIGFWPGGDRDGNPFVNSEITLKVAERLRESILKCYYADIRLLRRRITFQGVDRLIIAIEYTIYSMAFGGKDAYSSPDELMNELMNVRKKLISEHDGLFLDLLDAFILKIKIFGFYFATLDIRQDSRKHEFVWEVLLNTLSKTQNTLSSIEFGRLSQEQQVNYLLTLNILPGQLISEDGFINETINSIKAIQQIQLRNGENGCQRYVISNCQHPLHVIQIYVLAKLLTAKNSPALDVVPLFETIEDLAHAPMIMETLYSISQYRQHITNRGNKQTIMLGFSDGTKDGGYLRANWSIYRAKEELTQVSRKHGIKTIFFDGRGGPPARGGGNTHDFYASLGDTIEQEEVQITIQGQTISSNFGKVASCKYNIEQLLSAGLQGMAFSKTEEQLSVKDKSLLDSLASEGYQTYLSLKHHEKFVPYLENVTPLTFFSDTNIGSRPAKRNASEGLKFEDLRAIPFVSAWAMMKQNIPGFYGVGSAIESLKEQARLDELKELYQRSLFFRTLIGNSMMSLTKTYYQATACLGSDKEYGEFWKKMYAEFELSCKNVLEVSGLTALMENNIAIRDSVRLREQIVLPLIGIQQFALMSLRELDDDAKALENRYRKLIIRCMFGIINAARNSA